MTNTALHDQATVLRPTGSLEGQQVEFFKAALAKAFETGGGVVVDLSCVEALSNDAMGALRAAAAGMRKRGGTLIILNPTAPAPRAVDFERIDTFLQARQTHTSGRIPLEVESRSW